MLVAFSSGRSERYLLDSIVSSHFDLASISKISFRKTLLKTFAEYSVLPEEVLSV